MKAMLLQDAVILGDTLKRCDPDQWLKYDGSCGCAFGGALLAAGVDGFRLIFFGNSERKFFGEKGE